MKLIIFSLFFLLSLMSNLSALENIDDFQVFTHKPGEAPTESELTRLEETISSNPNLIREILETGRIVIILDKEKKEYEASIKTFVRETIERTLSNYVTKRRDIVPLLGKDISLLLLKRSKPVFEVAITYLDWKETKTKALDIAIEEVEKIPAGQEEKVLSDTQYDPQLLRQRNETDLQREQRITKVISKIFFRTILMVKTGLVAVPSTVAYLGSSFAKSVTKPTKAEVIQGVTSKAYPFIQSMIYWASTMNHNIPYMVSAMGLSFCLDTFHGLFVNTWSKFQERISKKGTSFQTLFNFFYGQFWGVSFRSFVWAAGSKNGEPVPAPWSIDFLSKSFFASLIQSPIETRGINGLNEMVRRGYITEATRSFICQWVRDPLFMLYGLFLYGNRNVLFGSFYAARQLVDSGYYIHDKKLTKSNAYPPIMLIVPQDIAETQEFRDKYPELFLTTGKELIQLGPDGLRCKRLDLGVKQKITKSLEE